MIMQRTKTARELQLEESVKELLHIISGHYMGIEAAFGTPFKACEKEKAILMRARALLEDDELFFTLIPRLRETNNDE